MNIVNGRLFNNTVLKEVSPEDREFSERMNINEIIIVFRIKPKCRLPELIRLNVPIKIIIDAVMNTFET